MKEKALNGAPIWFKKILAYLFRGQPPYPMLAPGLFTQLRNRGIPVWYVSMSSILVYCDNVDNIFLFRFFKNLAPCSDCN